MASSVFTRFLRTLAGDWSKRYAFAKKLEVATGDARVPKASTFDLGYSPEAHKHVLLNFQASPKAWEVGCFTINVNFSTVPREVVRSVTFGTEEFRHFEEGYYRIPLAAGERDTWWCLQPPEDGQSRTSDLVVYWEPTGYASEDEVLAECVASVNEVVERIVLRPLGFIESSKIRDEL